MTKRDEHIAYVKGYKRGYQKGRDRGINECQNNATTFGDTAEAYQKGLEDAWSYARTLYGHSTKELLDMGIYYSNLGEIVKHYEIDEIIEKYAEWLEKKQDGTGSGELYAGEFERDDDHDDDMTINEAIANLKKGQSIPYKHKTLDFVINALEQMKGGD